MIIYYVAKINTSFILVVERKEIYKRIMSFVSLERCTLRLKSMLFKLDAILYFMTKRIKSSSYKEFRPSIITHLCNNTQLTMEDEYFYVDLYNLISWDKRHLGVMVPYSRSLIVTCINEGPHGVFFNNYSRDNQGVAVVNCSSLKQYFSFVLRNKDGKRRIFYMDKIRGILSSIHFNELLKAQIFWVLSTIIRENNITVYGSDLLGTNFFEYLMTLIMFDLQKEVL